MTLPSLKSVVPRNRVDVFAERTLCRKGSVPLLIGRTGHSGSTHGCSSFVKSVVRCWSRTCGLVTRSRLLIPFSVKRLSGRAEWTTGRDAHPGSWVRSHTSLHPHGRRRGSIQTIEQSNNRTIRTIRTIEQSNNPNNQTIRTIEQSNNQTIQTIKQSEQSNNPKNRTIKQSKHSSIRHLFQGAAPILFNLILERPFGKTKTTAS